MSTAPTAAQENAPPARPLRGRAARGVILNGAFSAGLATLALVRGLLVAGLLSIAEFGRWGLLVTLLVGIVWLKDVGIRDGFVRQKEADQERAFQQAFTLELLLCTLLGAVMAAAVAIASVALGERGILVPGLVLALFIPAQALQTPYWVFYRDLDFARMRRLQAVDPVVGTIIVIALAAAGYGVWSLVVGTVAGAWLSAAVAIRKSPYRLRWRYDRAVARRYASFSWPLMLATASGLAIGQLMVFSTSAAVGLAGVAAVTLGTQFSKYATQVDNLVSGTMYPVLARVAERRDLLLESFVKSNRVALMWGVPFGAGFALFSDDLVDFVIGDKWRYAIPLLQAFGAIAVIHQIAFNWTAYMRVLGRTRPITVAAVVTLASFAVTAVPGVFLWGLDGLCAGAALAELVYLAVKVRYMRGIFPRFRILPHVVRAVWPVVPAVVAVLALEAAMPDTAPAAILQLAVFGTAVVAVTALAERRLLREMVSYLRRPRTAAAA